MWEARLGSLMAELEVCDKEDVLHLTSRKKLCARLARATGQVELRRRLLNIIPVAETGNRRNS